MPQRTPEAIASYREAHANTTPREAQCRAALERANARRTERRLTIEAIKDGHLTFTQIMANPPDCLNTYLAISVAMLVPGVGKTRRDRIAIRAFNLGVLVTKDLGDLTERQRTILARVVAEA